MTDVKSDPIVIIGQAIRLPGVVDDLMAFERLLFEGRSGFGPVPADRFDRALYFDARRGQLGKSYTDLGGSVSATPLDAALESRIASLGSFDLTHRQFAQVAARAWSAECQAIPGLARRCGVFVGHSGGTDQGGPLTMSMLAEAAIDPLREVEAFENLDPAVQQQVIDNVIASVRRDRPSRTDDSVHFNAYSAASLVARLLSLGGPREVIDAACASSLLALSHAAAAIEQGRIDAAIVGGATYNNVDNLILFSQSQACSDQGSCPFDGRASGLISSEGYVAIVVTRQSLAVHHGLPILGVICGIGIASDGRGKSLWAPRTEGQQLAIRRGYAADAPLEIDYLEAHATSTQVGDATELHSLDEILSGRTVALTFPPREREDLQSSHSSKTESSLPPHPQATAPRGSSEPLLEGEGARKLQELHKSEGAAQVSSERSLMAAGRRGPLLVGSVKSNLGHTLEAAGLVGLVKLVIAMRRGEIPPTIHFQEPTPEFDWSAGSIRVVSETLPWPANNRPRRCAVNAFGIGGINGHVVIESSPPQRERVTGSLGRPAASAVGSVRSPFSSAQPDSAVSGGRHRVRQPKDDEPIAIVGRGVVLPGAFTVEAFARLLQSDTGAIGPPPPRRWRGRAGVADDSSPVQLATDRGGFIVGYHFDGQPYRIPPKQVQLANPAQMMLIDAVQQAASEMAGTTGGEAGAGTWMRDRQKTSVVIGTIFGGEFSNQLQIGLRLPELCQRLFGELRRGGVGETPASQMVSEYHRLMLREYPALLDETGSFTASTLASRIAKSFDLMGGACAVDADDASGSLALMVAADQLRCGTVDTVVCGVAQRSLDLVGFHDLQICGRLVPSGRIEDIPADCSRVLPGEGVAVVLLRRLSDALRDQMPIWGLIDDFEVGTHDDAVALRQACLGEAAINQGLVRRIGYLAGAHSLVRLVAETIQWQSSPPSCAAITSVAEDGFYVRSSIRHRSAARRQTPGPLPSQRVTQTAHPTASKIIAPYFNPITLPSGHQGAETVEVMGAPCSGIPRSTPDTAPRMMNATDPGSCRAIRIEGQNEADFERALRRAAESPDAVFSRTSPPFSPQSRYRGGAVVASVESFSAAVDGLIRAWQAGQRTTVLDRHLALMWDRGRGNDRVAWAFPGQGSQYSAVPSVVSEEASARTYLQCFDALLAELGLPAVSDRLADPQQQLGHDVWWTQLWVLAVSATLADSLVRDGQHPDLVLGHSFGECGAAIQAGVMSLAQAIRFAKQRSEAVVMTSRQRGQLLSIRGTPSRVEAVLASLGADLTITHHNAPEQTVIAGPPEAIAAARAALTAASMASVVIPVPAAFHTPAMEDARHMLRSTFGDERFRPPRYGFFSTVQNRYLAEPCQIRDSLIDQLTSPLLYCGAIQRVVGDGCGLLIEVGPSDVLTRLHREIVGSSVLCVSLDGRGHSHRQRLALVRLACECVAGSGTPESSSATFSQAAVQVIDVTRRGRARSKAPRPVTALMNAEPTAQAAALKTPIEVVAGSEHSALGSLENVFSSVQTDTLPPGDATTRNDAMIAAIGLAPSQSQSTAAEFAFDTNGNVSRNGSSENMSADRRGLAERFLVDWVVELTGYSPDVIDFEADLEAELGVDSIKKAQIIGELAEWASLELDLRQMKLSDFNSLADIRQLVGDRLVGDIPADFSPADSPVINRENNPHATEPRGYERQEANRAGGDSDSWSDQQTATDRPQGVQGVAAAIQSLMVDFIIDQTGYSPEVIDMEADLEAELGLDSIKKAQLLGELASHYELNQIDLRRIRLADFPTLHSIREFVLENLSSDILAAPEGNRIAAGSIGYSEGVKKKMIRRALRALVDAPSQESRGALLSLFEVHQLSDIRAQGPAGRSLTAVATESGVLPASLWRWLGNGQLTPTYDQDKWDQAHNGAQTDVRTGPGSSAPVVTATYQPLVAPPQPIPRRGTCRFGLRMVEVPRHPRMPTEPRFSGSGLILGKNAIADAIAARLQQRGITAHRLDPSASFDQLDTRLTTLWASCETPHLFLTTPHDADALQTLSTQAWQRRRDIALVVPFRVCQLWMQRMIDRGMMDQAFLVSVLNTGGDFALSASRVPACESGGLSGLTKAMMIEAWTQGFRETPMKVIDIAPETSVEQAVDGIFRELAVPSHDEEVRVEGATRWVVWPEHRPLEISAASDAQVGSQPGETVTVGGTWIVSGGGRGITAMTSLALAEKYSLVLHLLGTAAVPALDESIRQRAQSDRAALRRETIHRAQQSGDNPIEAWRDLEKAIEIDQTLSECRRRGIRGTYHQIDVSDACAVGELFERIRGVDGPIRGVIHGAGAGQDARFDRKRPGKVEKCIRAKVDGCMALAEATAADPLEWFVGFGSISGRFGANGHADYSLANDMLAKVIDRLRQQRPVVRCVTFHWHAWGDIGMATKPEAKLALEMIGMEFMPAQEGLAHFLAEFESGGDLAEVLITDRNYIRKFFPSFGDDTVGAMNLPLIDPDGNKRGIVPASADEPWLVTIDPLSDRFLSEHRVGGRPTLPFVVALEMMAEAAAWEAGGEVVSICNAEAKHPLKFIGDDAMAIEIAPHADTEAKDVGSRTWCVRADLRRRDGRLVESNRIHFLATIRTGLRTAMPSRLTQELELGRWEFEPIEYLGPEASIYHGDPFQMLRSIATGDAEAVGKILTPSPVHLGEEKRPARGWVLPCAVMDAMLYATAILGWRVSGRASLPVRFETIQLGRSPEPGEALLVHTRIADRDDSGLTLAADLIGLNGDRLLALRGYRIQWLQ